MVARITEMDLETSFKKIKQAFQITSSKDVEVVLRYVGNSGGITEPWILMVDSYTTKGKDWEEAAAKMLSMLKVDLEKKIKFNEDLNSLYKKTLNNLLLD